MTDKQIEIADRILSEMKIRNGFVNKDNLLDFFTDPNTDIKTNTKFEIQVKHVISFLEEYKLVEWAGSNGYTLKFRLDGQKASDIGIVEFLRQRELEKQQHILHIDNSNINFGSNSGQQIHLGRDNAEATIIKEQTNNAPAQNESTSNSFWLSTTSQIIAGTIVGIIVAFVTFYCFTNR